MSETLAIFQAECSVVLEKEFKETHPIKSGYRANLKLHEHIFPSEVEVLDGEIEPGEKGRVRIRCILSNEVGFLLVTGSSFDLLEMPHKIADCRVIEIEQIESINL